LQISKFKSLSREKIKEKSLTIVKQERFRKLEKKYERLRSELKEFLNYLFNTVLIHYINKTIRDNLIYEIIIILKRTLLSLENKRKY
jgi:hypothetical protein